MLLLNYGQYLIKKIYIILSFLTYENNFLELDHHINHDYYYALNNN